ncbi:SGNH/GDSL hydrolase family protein [Yoonia sp. 2307UL14-13]|uniref:SGNH/GDSL hydrolase family protein n=1 Tax=Yoonia sp. 2307UL14-13 TaxID=3126506 RepID=UPI0030AE3525
MIVDLAARVGLFPVLAAQAVYAKSRALALPEPPGERSGQVGDGPPLRILILGDSSAAGVGVEMQDQALLGHVTRGLSPVASVSFELIAKTGARTGDVLEWLPDVPDGPYDVVVTALGVNDVTKAVPLRRWLHQQETLITRLRQDFGARRIVVSGLPPVSQFPLLPQPLRWTVGRRAEMFDRALVGLVSSHDDCVYLKADMELDHSNMSPDGFHPGPEVYARWAEKVVAAVMADPPLLDPVEGRA